jgi:hypothetical protein
VVGEWVGAKNHGSGGAGFVRAVALALRSQTRKAGVVIFFPGKKGAFLFF